MNIELPYPVGTIVREKGVDENDEIKYYIVGQKTQVVLILCLDTRPRESTPIDLKDFLERWQVMEEITNEKKTSYL